MVITITTIGIMEVYSRTVSSFKSLLHKHTMFFANKLYTNAMA